jgi:hypothetical protein
MDKMKKPTTHICSCCVFCLTSKTENSISIFLKTFLKENKLKKEANDFKTL